MLNWNATIEYQISANNLIKVFYTGSAGVHLVESWNINAFPTSFGAGNPALQNAAFANTQAYLPYPQFGTINHMANTGHSSFHAGTVEYSKRYSQGLVLDSFYTYSKALDDCDTDYGTCTGVAPITDRNLNKGRAGYDMRHRFVTSFTYELPVGKGRRFRNKGGFLDYVIGGYDLSWIQTVDTGNPFGFSFANSPYNYYPTSIGARVPNLVATPTMAQFGLGLRHRTQSLQSERRVRCGRGIRRLARELCELRRSHLQHLRLRSAAAVHAGECRTQHSDRSGGLFHAILRKEKLPDHRAY